MKKQNQIAAVITSLLLLTGVAFSEPAKEKSPQPQPVLLQAQTEHGQTTIIQRSETKKIKNPTEVKSDRIKAEKKRKKGNRRSHFLMPPLDFDDVF